MVRSHFMHLLFQGLFESSKSTNGSAPAALNSDVAISGDVLCDLPFAILEHDGHPMRVPVCWTLLSLFFTSLPQIMHLQSHGSLLPWNSSIGSRETEFMNRLAVSGVYLWSAWLQVVHQLRRFEMLCREALNSWPLEHLMTYFWFPAFLMVERTSQSFSTANWRKLFSIDKEYLSLVTNSEIDESSRHLSIS